MISAMTSFTCRDTPIQSYVDHICHQIVTSSLRACRIEHDEFNDVHARQVVDALMAPNTATDLSSLHGRPHHVLQRLEITSCPCLGAQGVSLLVDAIATCRRRQHSKENDANHTIQITRLDIESVPMGDEGLASITRLLVQEANHLKGDDRKDENSSSSSSKLQWLGLEDVGVQKLSSWQQFLQVTLSSPHLKSLNLSRNMLSLDHVTVLASAMIQNHPHEQPGVLESLILSDNPNIGDEGVEELCQIALQQPNNPLRLLALGNCGLSPRGMKHLTHCLRYNNCHLERIYIYSNPHLSLEFYDSQLYYEFGYFLELNAHGQRALLRNSGHLNAGDNTTSSNTDNSEPPRSKIVYPFFRSTLLPHILAKVPGSQPELVYGLLTELPHVWCS